MTDGNTALPVSPVNKEDAMSLSSLFSKAAQAIVDASNYPEQVKALEAKIEVLTKDLANKTVHAEELDRTVHELREQRDQAKGNALTLTEDLRMANDHMAYQTATIQTQNAKIEAQAVALDHATKDRDNYGMQVLELEEQVRMWKEKAEQARIRVNDVLALFKEPEPAPKPTPVDIPAFIEPKPIDPVTVEGTPTTAPWAMATSPTPTPEAMQPETISSPALGVAVPPETEATPEADKPWWMKD